MDVYGKSIVITDAASDIGRTKAIAFHSEGAKSILVSDINEQGARAVSDRNQFSYRVNQLREIISNGKE